MASRGVLEGKLAIVTGAAKQNGIGFATAMLFAQNGADVCAAIPAPGLVNKSPDRPSL